MRKRRLQLWVKNVHNLRIQGGESSVHMSPIINNSLIMNTQYSNNSAVLLSFIPDFTAVLSTIKNGYLHLLYNRLYPQSTAPTIKKKKQNIKKGTQ